MSHLVDVLNGSGGLHLKEVDEDADGIAVPKSEHLDDDDDIVVPKSEYLDEDDVVVNDASAGADSVKVESVSSDDIRIAVAKDKTTPYANEWLELSDDSMVTSLEFKDYMVLAFAYGDEEFYITEGVYDE